MSESDKIGFGRMTPILRVFDVAKMREFYVDYLGCAIDWEHRFGDDFPLYCQASRGALVLHLSEHHGDACPGAAVRIATTALDALHAELHAKNYRYLKPGIESQPWGRDMTLNDPFGNKLIFYEARVEPR